MQRDRERLGHRALGIAHAVGKQVGLYRLDHDLLAKRALHVRHAHRAAVVAHVQAVVLQAELAVAALPARPARADRDPVADRQAADAGADRVDRARDLVAQHHRLLQADAAEAAVLPVVQVGAADAADAHPHADLAGADRGSLDGFDPQVAGGVDDECVHGSRA